MYSARLGVEPVTRAPQLVMFDLPGARLTLHEADGFNQPGPAGTVPYWTVSDVDATVAQWSERTPGTEDDHGQRAALPGTRSVRAAAAASLTRGARGFPGGAGYGLAAGTRPGCPPELAARIR